jgi:hypothetical protein
MLSTVAMPVPPRQRKHVEERTGPEINMANHGHKSNVEKFIVPVRLGQMGMKNFPDFPYACPIWAPAAGGAQSPRNPVLTVPLPFQNPPTPRSGHASTHNRLISTRWLKASNVQRKLLVAPGNCRGRLAAADTHD